MITFGSPARYHQGPGCLARLGEIVSAYGSKVAVIADAVVYGVLKERVQQSFAAAGLELRTLLFRDDVTEAAIAALMAEIAPEGAVDLVVAIGGGKAIDAGKAVAHRLGCRIVTVPTAATNDAPTSKNYVVYDEHHALVEVAHLPLNPIAVVVDTEVIAGAPAGLIVAGIGDAVTKAFEARQCFDADGRNMFGDQSSAAAVALAEAGYRILREHAVEAQRAAGTGKSSVAFERLVETMFLMGGLGFESGGLSIAHAMTRGLSRVAGAAEAMHGAQVAYGLMVQLVLERRSEDFLADMRAFYRQVGLPVSLAELGASDTSDAAFSAIAGPTLAAPHAKNFERRLEVQDLVDAMRRLERAQ